MEQAYSLEPHRLACGSSQIFYGRWLAKKWGVDNAKKTPAVEINDGIDYVPTKKQVVFGLSPNLEEGPY